MDDLYSAQTGYGGTVSVAFHGNVAVVTMEHGQNWCNSVLVRNLHRALDQVLENKQAEVLVTTGTGKYYENGMDIAWLQKLKKAGREEQIWDVMSESAQFVARLLTFPLPTICALNGHAFAMGAMMSMAHDYRIMQKGKGWWCLNEVHLGLNIPPAFNMLIASKLPVPTLHEASVLGKMYTAEEGKQAGIIHRVTDADKLSEETLEFAKRILPKGGYKREYLETMKVGLYGQLCQEMQKSMKGKFAIMSRL